MARPEYEAAEAIREVRDLALATTTGEELIGRRVAWVVPEGTKLQIEDFSKHYPTPLRKTGTAKLREVQSFIDYVNRHKTDGTEIFIHDLNVRAVLNGHRAAPAEDDPIAEEALAGWGDHVATFEPRYTPGWTAWLAYNGNWIEQRDFALFLENRIPEIARPDGADLVDAISNLRVKYEVNFERVIETTNDFVQLQWREDADTGVFKVPNKLTLALTMYEGGERYILDARLRFSKPDQHGRVKFRFDLTDELHTIQLQAQQDLRDLLTKGLENVPMFIGNW